MKPACLLLLGGLCLALAAPAHAVKLEYRVKAGQTWKSKMTMKGAGATEAAGMRFDMTMEMMSSATTTVKSVETDGTFTQIVDQKMDSMKVTVAGMTIDAPPPMEQKPITITSTKLGKPIKFEGLDGLAKQGNIDFSKLLGASPAQFPDKDINVGESWDASPNTPELPLRMTGKLLSIKRLGGREVAELEYVFSISGESLGKLVKAASGLDLEVSGPGMTGKTVTEVEVATGVPGATKGTMEMDMTIKIMGMELRQAMKMEIIGEAVR